MFSKNSIFVLSNGSTDVYPNNTLTSFKNKFPISLQQKRKRYQIAVQGICMSQKFKHIISPSKSNEFSVLILKKKDDRTQLKVNNGRVFITTDEFHIKEITFNDDNSSSIKQITTVFNAINKFISSETNYSYFSLINNNLLQISNQEATPFYVCCHSTFIKSFGIPQASELKKLPKQIKEYSYNEDEFNKLLHVFENNYEDLYATTDIPNIKKINFSPIFTLANYESCDYACFKIIEKTSSWLRGTRDITNKYLPRIIKINSPQIEEQIFNNEFTRDIVCFAPVLDLDGNQDCYYQEFKNKQYVTLENTIFDSLEIKLLDENNQQLELLTGVATFIHLKLRRMTNRDEESISLHLSSEPTKGYETNKPHKFKVKLPQEIYVDDTYKLALTSLNYPCNFVTYPKDEYCIMALKHSITKESPLTFTSESFGFKLPKKSYTSESLVKTIHRFLRDNNLAIAYLGRQNKVDISLNTFIGNGIDEITFLFSKSLMHIIGYNDTFDFEKDHDFNTTAKIKLKPFEESSDEIYKINNSTVFYNHENYVPIHVAKFNKIINQGIRVSSQYNQILECDEYPNLTYLHPKYLMIYLNVLNPSLVGGEFLKILKILPIKYSHTLFYIEDIDSKDYISLQNNVLNVLEFEIRGHDGEFICFPDNYNVLLNLKLSNR